MDLIARNGFMWPADDGWCHKVIHEELGDLDAAVRLCRGHEVAVQAGGNVGVWASHLAKRFKRVVTAEPDVINYKCLTLNVPDNVEHHRAAFGAEPSSIGLVYVEGNAGAHYAKADGDIPVLTIDSLGLEACDLICLDVEGYEPMALRGAEQTIRRCKPVIMFEEKGLSQRYFGVPEGTAERWVVGLGMGYSVKARVRRDVILA